MVGVRGIAGWWTPRFGRVYWQRLLEVEGQRLPMEDNDGDNPKGPEDFSNLFLTLRTLLSAYRLSPTFLTFMSVFHQYSLFIGFYSIDQTFLESRSTLCYFLSGGRNTSLTSDEGGIVTPSTTRGSSPLLILLPLFLPKDAFH